METKLKLLPDEPGVYLFQDAGGRVLYVGKAASLKNRVRSYFQTTADPKTQRLMQAAVEVDYIVTASERHALLLEETLIKKHQPRFNIRLKDDRRYPYLKFTREPFPKLEFARRRERDGAQYFGPYRSGEAVRETIKLLQKIFRLRTCNLEIQAPPVRQRPCLDHYIGLCDAPCVGAISGEDYAHLVEQAGLFLRGKSDELLERLRRQMAESAKKLEFERAARWRDQLRALERLREGGEELSPRPLERDLIAYAAPLSPACGHPSPTPPHPHPAPSPSKGEGWGEGERLCCVQVFFMRAGKLCGRESFFIETPLTASGTEILTAFAKQYYRQATAIPKEIVVPCALEESEALAAWLAERCGRAVTISVIERGPTKKLLDLVAHNAALALHERQALSRTPPVPSPSTGRGREGGPGVRAQGVLEELQQALKLSAPPRRIEAFDISNLHGRQAVGSLVVCWDGTPLKSAYRRFRVESVPQIDDCAMTAEVLRRRLVRALAGDARFLPLPDLILIDGGKGQLSAARAVLRALKLEIPTVAIAKEFEHLFSEGRASPIILPKESPALQLLQRLRDEAHRFALTYHRLLRERDFLRSALDEVPGLGPQRKARLLERFGSLRALKQATLEELRACLPAGVAEGVYRALRAT